MKKVYHEDNKKAYNKKIKEKRTKNKEKERKNKNKEKTPTPGFEPGNPEGNLLS